ncbi:MAG: PmoA family protein [Planctomycetaceae bacterium]
MIHAALRRPALWLLAGLGLALPAPLAFAQPAPALKNQAQPITASTEPAAAGNDATASPYRWAADDAGVSLMQADALVLRYEFRSGGKPIVYPLNGPGGVSMTRDFPIKPAGEGNSKDHVHQRSLWMTHGEVNGIDFWMEGEKAGRIQHDRVVSQDVAQRQAKLVTTAKWVTPEDQVVLHESRTMTVAGDDALRTIEFAIDLTAVDQPVHFGDTKEGSFGVRVADSMTVDKKQGGTIVNEHGEKDGEAWGKRARWVDYSGPVDGKTVGLTILEHPSSFGHPCRWHVRTYGLFAANPFGEHHFTGGKPTEGHTLAPGKTLHLQYLVLLHPGQADTEVIEAQWKQFAGQAEATR